MNNSRVVITGLGILCPIGDTVDEYATNLFAGRTCIAPIEGWDIEDKRFLLGGQLKHFDFATEMPEVKDKHIFTYAQYGMVAAKRAILDAGLPLDTINRDRIGTCMGTAAAGLSEAVQNDARRYFQRGDHGISPMLWAEFTPCACTTHVAIHYGFRGPSATQSSGCLTGIDSIAWSVTQLRAGNADIMVAGGADSLFTPFMWSAMYRSGIIAQAPEDGGLIPRPFSHDHNGIVLVDGGSALVLETETHARLRGARIYGEIIGIANCEEARPMTDLDVTGEAFSRTMQLALRDAGIPATDVDWVLAHGTGHPGGDCSESRGIETALGAHAFCIPVSSIRGAVGQSFASGGGFQAGAACLAIRAQRVPPTLNFSRPADGCRLDYVPNVSRTALVRRVLVNCAGVGGTHGAMIIARYEGAS